MRLVERLKPFRGVGGILSFRPHEMAFSRPKNLVFMHLCGVLKYANCLHIAVMILRKTPHCRFCILVLSRTGVYGIIKCISDIFCIRIELYLIIHGHASIP